MNKLNEFWYYIKERQNIYHRRFVLKEPAPWTTDPHLRDYKYTNVYPELDRGSIYIQNDIKDVQDPKDKFFRIVVYRLFNRIETFEQIKDYIYLDKFDAKKCIKILKEHRAKGFKITTDAFMVSGTGRYKTSSDKIEILLKDVIQNDIVKNFDVYYNNFVSQTSAKDAHIQLIDMRYVGEFLAYIMLFDAVCAGIVNHNMDEWCNPGPGAHKALKLIWPNILEKEALQYIIHLRNIHKECLGDDFKYYNNRPLTLVEIEWSLCEFQKYCSIKYRQFNAKIRFYKGVKNV